MLDGQEILRLLPHRYPILLIDRVLECVPREHIVGIKNLSRNEPLIRRNDAFPHLLVLEALAQLSVILTFRTLEREPTGSELVLFAGIDQAKFHSAAVAGDQLRLKSTLKRIRRGIGVYVGECTVDGQVLAQAQLTAAWRVGEDR